MGDLLACVIWGNHTHTDRDSFKRHRAERRHSHSVTRLVISKYAESVTDMQPASCSEERDAEFQNKKDLFVMCRLIHNRKDSNEYECGCINCYKCEISWVATNCVYFPRGALVNRREYPTVAIPG